jgi:hypothetical protein
MRTRPPSPPFPWPAASSPAPPPARPAPAASLLSSRERRVGQGRSVPCGRPAGAVGRRVSRARGLMSNQAAGGFDDEAEETEGGGHLYRPADSIIASFQGPCLVMYVPGRHDPNWDGVVDETDTCTAPASWTRHLFCLWAGFLLGPSRDRVAHRKRNKLLWFCRQLVPPYNYLCYRSTI